jgi:hypothetical protein
MQVSRGSRSKLSRSRIQSRGWHRNLDRVMDLGVHRPKSTIPVVCFDAVPSRTVNGESRRRARGRRPVVEDAQGRVPQDLCVTVKEGVQLCELQLVRGDG